VAVSPYPNPYLIEFSRLGKSDIGYISVAENGNPQVPFQVERIFWTYYTPESIVRGRHAHYRTEQVLVAIGGRILVTTEQADGTIEVFRLEDPHVGLYLPPHVWHTMQYSHSVTQLVLASTAYEEADYIRDHARFREVWQS
jgi:oxalate decarboxylase/phosphoglucose isomerase-like protein (cupin superfamily)